MKFIEVTETKYNEKVLINLEQVSHIFVEMKAIVLSGNHWSDLGAWGMLYLNQESMEKIMKELGWIE